MNEQVVKERFVDVPLTPREIRWLLDQIGSSVAEDPIRDEVEMDLERALFAAENGKSGNRRGAVR